MPEAFRIVKSKRAADAFTGEGARKNGGRWNSIGIPMVYAAGCASLAALEMLVHFDKTALLSSYVYFKVEFDNAQVEQVDTSSLPADWRDDPAPSELLSIGDDWIASGASVLLRVPSAVIPIEFNYLINPLHPDFHALQISAPVPFEFDTRLRH